MKILKIFGIVVGIHVFALILIFANPGCSSTSKPPPAPVDTNPTGMTPSTVSVPFSGPTTISTNFNPDAPAIASASSSGSRFFPPTRPGTPAAQAVTTTPVSDVTPAQTYAVKAGDTLWELGKKFKIPYAEIAAANNLKSNAPLHAGQKLIIPGTKPTPVTAPASAATNSKAGANGKTASTPATAGAATTSAPPPAATNSGNAMKHTVAPGETLSSIAHKYGVTVKELGTANNISDPQKVKAGQELVIPNWTAAGTNGKSSTKSGKGSSTNTPPPAPAETKPIFNLLDSTPAATPAPSGSEPPVNKVEDSPLSPTPKGK